MTRIVRSHYRYKWPSRRAKPAAWTGDRQRGLILTRTMLMELAQEIEAMGLTALAWRYRAVASGFDVQPSDRLH